VVDLHNLRSEWRQGLLAAFERLKTLSFGHFLVLVAPVTDYILYTFFPDLFDLVLACVDMRQVSPCQCLPAARLPITTFVLYVLAFLADADRRSCLPLGTLALNPLWFDRYLCRLEGHSFFAPVSLEARESKLEQLVLFFSFLIQLQGTFGAQKPSHELLVLTGDFRLRFFAVQSIQGALLVQNLRFKNSV